MENIIEFLKQLFPRALPTFFLIILLHWYLKKVLFVPLERVMAERKKQTAGAIEASNAALVQLDEKMAEYEKALGDARAEIYKEQDAARKRLADQQKAAVDEVRVKFAERVEAIKAEIALEMETATASLAGESDRLAEEIAGALLAGRAR